MKPRYLMGVFAVLAAMLLPCVARAQECSDYWWCESYITYDPVNNLVAGYSRTEDWYFSGTYLKTDAYLYDPNWSEMDGEQEGYYSAEVDFSFSPSLSGDYTLFGDHWIYWYIAVQISELTTGRSERCRFR